VYGVSVSPDDGDRFAFGVTDGTFTEDDDALVILTPDGLGRTGSFLDVEDFGSYTNTKLLRDVAWTSSGQYAVGEFYGSSSSGSDVELGLTDGGGGTYTATIDYCEQPISVAMDPIDTSAKGWVGCSGEFKIASVDLASVASSYTPSTSLYLRGSSGATANHYPTFVESAQNGAFIVVGAYWSAGASYTYVIPRGVSTGGGSVYTGSYNPFGATFTRPRGAAITPMLSIASPRPGTRVGGIKRFHVIVRDPSVTSVEFHVDGSLECTDTALADGSADSCEIDTFDWTSGGHVVTVIAVGGTNGDFNMGATYSTY
jgi:hypothetical protein